MRSEGVTARYSASHNAMGLRWSDGRDAMVGQCLRDEMDGNVRAEDSAANRLTRGLCHMALYLVSFSSRSNTSSVNRKRRRAV